MLSTRRGFLQQVGVWGTGLWLSDLSLRYQSVLAQPTPRKLALLVGLNQYSRGAEVESLKGCLTDVELHRELLVHRFGFRPSDILVLTDEAATREAIAAAFIVHLLEQARPGDVVVFHFSGYGCLVRTKIATESGAQQYGEQQALLPYDAWTPTFTDGEFSRFNSIYEETLFLLLRSLSTDQVITVLDVGIQPAWELRCQSLRERALPLRNLEAFSAAELVFQDRLLQQTQLTRDQVQVQRQSGQFPGLVLAAATPGQPTALELDRANFSAGLFSYALMQQLWTSTPETTIAIQFRQLSSQMTQQIGPSPQPSAKGQKSFGTLPWSNLFLGLPSCRGVVTSTDRRGQTAKICLAGLSEALLAALQPQSCWRGINTSTLLQLRSREGWTAIAQYLSGSPPQNGMFLEEAIRVIPRSLSLQLAFDTNLERIERVDATSSIDGGRYVEHSNIQVVGTTHSADYILTKLPAPSVVNQVVNQSDASDNSTFEMVLEPLPAARYGLAYLSGTLLPNTLGNQGEVIKLTMQRLQPTLDLLLALKWLELAINDTASKLRVIVTLEQVEDPPQLLMRQQTGEIPFPLKTEEQVEEVPIIPKADKISTILTLASGTPLQYRINNWNDFPIYVFMVGFNNATQGFASYGTESSNPSPEGPSTFKPIVIAPGASVVVPSGGQVWKASNTTGLNRTFMVLTQQPLIQTLAAQNRETRAIALGTPSGFTQLSRPLPVVQKIFEDLHQASLPATEAFGITSRRVWALDTQLWTTFQFVYMTQ